MDLDRYFEEVVPQKWNSDSDCDRNGSGSFDCNICLDSVQDPVVTLCGHLYCWPCIYKWLRFHSENQEQQRPRCPVCKSLVSQTSLVPLYGRGSTRKPYKGKASPVGMAIPPRPSGPAWMLDSSTSTNNTSTFPQPASQFYQRHYPYHPQQFNSATTNYTSSATNASDSTFGVFGEMIFARVFGNRVTNLHTYPDSYRLTGNNNPRIRRQLMQADKSLSRISFFLLCCVVLCLLLF
ncbi:hypothetical protein L6164_018716 [Bauhinia variegata]|uniref:Uncharacterized protein n=1 Tax=Bauhinia variegata TaxID=167791 RepID=A0ACB9NDA3_BAUVA|nr:hypothetical protein L6164_018716 [Bauhinia variegata]